MTSWICSTCAVEYRDSENPPAVCAICDDERQYVRPSGQEWTALADLADSGRTGSVLEIEPRLFGISVDPAVGIGQQALLARTPAGNLLWDPTGYVDDALAALVEGVGGVAAIAASHPHMFGVQVEWSRRFGDAPVYVCAADREWVRREDAVLEYWQDGLDVLPGVALQRIGGHFAGSAVARWTGSDGRGVLLSGDTVAATPGEDWVSYMRSYPNKVPLSAAVVSIVAERVLSRPFDRLYDNFGGGVREQADDSVRRSADRYIAWVRGDFDHRTGTSV